MLTRNPVAKHFRKSCISSVVPQKRRSLQSDAILRDADQIVSEGLFYSETITFESGSTICWDESEDSLQGCMNCVGCANIEIDCEEE